MIRDDWSFWAVLPVVLMVVVIGAYFVQLGIERRQGRSSGLTSGDGWTAAGALVMLASMVLPPTDPARTLGLAGAVLMAAAPSLR